MADKIKSLDELRTGDVIKFECWPCIEGVPFVVEAVGEVPEHEKEVLLQILYSPDSNEVPDSKVEYEPRTLKESMIGLRDVEKLKREDYLGWRYKTIRRIN